MANNKRIAINTIYLYLRTGITIFVGLYASRLLLDALGAVDFGLYFLVAGIVLLLGFLKSSLTSGVQRFLAFEVGKDNLIRLNSTYSTAINIHLIAVILFLLIGETAGLYFVLNGLNVPSERIGAIFWVYQASLIGFCFTIITLPHLALILAREHIKIFATVTLLESILKLLITIALGWLLIDRLVVYAFLILGLNIAVSASYVLYCRRRFIDIKYTKGWDSELVKSISSFSAWTIIGNLSSVLSNQGAAVLLNIFFGPIVNAAKAIANQVEGAATSFSGNFMVALTPPIIKSYSAGDFDYTRKLVYAGSRYSFFLMLIITFSLFFNMSSVLNFWLGTFPPQTSEFTQVILIISLLTAMSRPFTAAAQATGKIKAYQLTVGGTLLLSLPVALIMLQAGKPAIWVFYSILGVNLVAFVARIMMLRRVFSFSIRDFVAQSMLRMVLVTVIVCTATYTVNVELDGAFSHLICNLLIDLCLTIIAVLLFGFSKFERRFIRDKIRERITHVVK